MRRHSRARTAKQFFYIRCRYIFLGFRTRNPACFAALQGNFSSRKHPAPESRAISTANFTEETGPCLYSFCSIKKMEFFPKSPKKLSLTYPRHDRWSFATRNGCDSSSSSRPFSRRSSLNFYKKFSARDFVSSAGSCRSPRVCASVRRFPTSPKTRTCRRAMEGRAEAATGGSELEEGGGEGGGGEKVGGRAALVIHTCIVRAMARKS